MGSTILDEPFFAAYDIGMSDQKSRNIIDSYRAWSEELIQQDLQRKAFPYAVLMQQIQGDFNMGTVVRNANAFGAQKVYYYGHRKWDRRSSVGTHNYTMVEYLTTLEELKLLKTTHVFVALEQNSKSIPLKQFCWPNSPFILVLGEEGPGISPEILELCDLFVEIPMFGSVRSLNVGTASGIAMHDLVLKCWGQ